ncbi:hypothetical protein BG004_003376, partial [Podila humilis]
SHYLKFSDEVCDNLSEREGFSDLTWPFIRGALTLVGIRSRCFEVPVVGTKERKNHGRDLVVETEEQASMADGVAISEGHQIYLAEAALIHDPKLDKGPKDKFKVVFQSLASFCILLVLARRILGSHTSNSWSRSNRQPPSPILAVPSPEPILDEETKLPIPNEYEIPVVYKGSRVQGIEPTTKWYRFIYKPGTTPMEKVDKGRVPHPEYWLDGRKLSGGEKRWFDLLSKFDFFVSSIFHGKQCVACQSEMGHWYEGLRDEGSYLAVQLYGATCGRCYRKHRNEEAGDKGNHPCTLGNEDKWAIQVRAGVQLGDPKSRSCLNCGKDCNRDNCRITTAHGDSRFSPLCKECERMERASADLAQRAANYFMAWWPGRGRRLMFKSRIQAEGFVLTVFLRGVCVGAPQFSGREVAHLRLQAQGSASIDWYDHEPLAAGDRDPMKQFSTDRTTFGNDKKILPYSHCRQCTVAASAWKNAIFMDLTLEQRVDYMLYWCDRKKREEGFQNADAILLKLCDGFNPEEEMKIGFTIRDEHCWREFCHSKRKKKERIAWNKYEWRYFLRTSKGIDLCSGLSMAEIGQLGHIDRLTDDGKYRLGACIYVPQGLNFAKELLKDFKTSELFQGTNLENCRKGIEMLRALMIKTAEKMRPHLSK